MHEVEDTDTPGPVGSLFSTFATDNAEVVPPDAHRGFDQMWSTDARGEPEEAVDAELLDDSYDDGHGPHGPNPFAQNGRANGWAAPPRATGPTVGGPFSAEPVSRSDEVIDEPEPYVDAEPPPFRGVHSPQNGAAPVSTPAGEPLFSSGRPGVHEPEDPWIDTGAYDDHAAGTPHFAPEHGAEEHRQRGPSEGAPPPYRHAGLDGSMHSDRDLPDPNGLRRAVGRLDPVEADRAAVPIAVVGALLHEHEQVLVAVTGQMLGRPAVVVLTPQRVLVVNDRRWQPIVDEFALDSSLVVRGRHDSNVAALSFADTSRLSMVDGISEVAIAIDLAERIRQVGEAAAQAAHRPA